jgi:DNA-binding MarR family transcriptional regulator
VTELDRHLDAIETELKAIRIHAALGKAAVAPAITAQEAYRARRRRDCAFGPLASLFGEPSWDMLLALSADYRPTQVSSACYAAMGAPTTALRHIGRLAAAGLVQRAADEKDGRRSLLTLTPHARALINAALGTAPLEGRA